MRKLLSLVLALSLGVAGPLHAEQPKSPAKPGGSAKPSSEKAVLDKFVGTWQGDIEITTADGKKIPQTWRNSFAWTLNEAFLKDEGGDVDGTSSFVGYWSYDPGKKRYRSWYFVGPDGTVGNLVYTWNEEAQVLKGSTELDGGVRIETVDRFLDADRYEWSTTVTAKDGSLIRKITAMQKRMR